MCDGSFDYDIRNQYLVRQEEKIADPVGCSRVSVFVFVNALGEQRRLIYCSSRLVLCWSMEKNKRLGRLAIYSDNRTRAI